MRGFFDFPAWDVAAVLESSSVLQDGKTKQEVWLLRRAVAFVNRVCWCKMKTQLRA